MSGGGGGAPAPKNPWDDLKVNTQQGYTALQTGFNPGANTQQQGASYAQLRNQGFGDDAIRSSVQSVYGQQPQDWYAVRRAAGPYEGLGVNTQQGFNTLVGAAGQDAAGKGGTYNALLRQGFGNEAIRSSANELFGNQSDADWNDMVTQAGLAAGRPLPGSAQFYQPAYQPQYKDLNTGNRMGVSQFGQPQATPQMQTPFNFGGQMMGGGYGQFGMNNPFSPYSNSFLNMPSNLQGATPAQKADVYRDAMSRGFNDTQMRSQATGLYGPQSNQDWSYLQNQAAQMAQMQTPFQPQPAQSIYGPTPLPNYVRDTISDLDRYQSQPVQAYQPSAIRSSGPASRIVSRSAQARGNPNVMMRRAEGGIASLVDDE